MLLILAVALAVTSLKVRELTQPPTGDTAKQTVQDLLALPDDALEVRLSAMWNDLATQWANAGDKLYQVTNSKATWLAWSQKAVLGAAIVAGLVTALILFGVQL